MSACREFVWRTPEVYSEFMASRSVLQELYRRKVVSFVVSDVEELSRLCLSAATGRMVGEGYEW
jgi:hypothetical protein